MTPLLFQASAFPTKVEQVNLCQFYCQKDGLDFLTYANSSILLNIHIAINS